MRKRKYIKYDESKFSLPPDSHRKILSTAVSEIETNTNTEVLVGRTRQTDTHDGQGGEEWNLQTSVNPSPVPRERCSKPPNSALQVTPLSRSDVHWLLLLHSGTEMPTGPMLHPPL